MSTSPGPVYVAAEPDTGLTSWLWLVTWLLAGRRRRAGAQPAPVWWSHPVRQPRWCDAVRGRT